jgi:membrane protein
MILLLWVYYSCQILLLGAEFTRVYAEHRGATFDPHVFAERARRTQSGDTRNRLDVTQPASANT